MSERRALLDPKIYKISEEDSQDEEVLSALQQNPPTVIRNENNGRFLGWTSQGMKFQKPSWASSSAKAEQWTGVTGPSTEEVKWPTRPGSDTDSDTSLSKSSGATDESEQCWTCSSSEADDESEDDKSWTSSCTSSTESRSSCSSCDTKFPNTLGPPPSVSAPTTHRRHRSNLQTFRKDRFRHNDKNRARENSNYFLLGTDIESHTDVDGNVRIIEFYSVSSGSDLEDAAETEIEEENLKLSEAPPKSHQLQRNEAQGPAKGGSEGRIVRFLRRKSKKVTTEVSKLAGERPSKNDGQEEAMARRKNNVTSGGSSSSWETDSVFSVKSQRQIRHVNLTLSNRINLEAPVTSYLETLLGIIPQKSGPNGSVDMRRSFSEEHVRDIQHLPSSSTNRSDDKDRIKIADFVPDSPAAKSRHLHIGDWIRTINGIVVNPLNVEFILSAMEQRQPSTRGKGRRHPGTSKYQIKIGVTRSETQTTPSTESQTRESGEIEEQELKVKKSSMSIAYTTKRVEMLEAESIFHRNEKSMTLDGDLLKTAPKFFLFFVTTERIESRTSQLKECITYTWPPKETLNGPSAQIYQSLVNTIPMTVTIYGILKKDMSNAHTSIRSQMEIAGRKMDVECWSDDGGRSILLLMSNETPGSTRCLLPSSISPTPLAQLITGALTFKWDTLERAFRKENHNEVTTQLSKFLSNAIDVQSTVLPHLPRVPVKPSYHRQEEILDQINQLDGGHWIKDGDNAEHGYCLGVCVFFEQRIVASTITNELLHKCHCWILAELNWTKESKWPPVKRLLIVQKLAGDSRLVMLVGKEHVLMLVLLYCPDCDQNTFRKRIQLWIEKMATILFRILLITKPQLQEIVSKRSSSQASSVETIGSAQPTSHQPRNNVIGTAWNNLKNKVAKSKKPELEMRKDKNVDVLGASVLEEYKIIFLAKIDSVRGLVKIHEEDPMPHQDELWNRVQMILPGLLERLNTVNECGHFVKLPKSQKTIWIGGRNGHGRNKLVVCLIGEIVLENLQKMLDKIEEDD